MDAEKSMVINASPTKNFFISMLVKDIKLIRAILDLVDNCVDGARRIRANDDYHGLTVRLEVTLDHFKISDNCGGMSVDVARNYAFRFGRPDEMQPTPHSIGQFGVGMKRALFKLGNKFRVESTTYDSHFVVEEDVREWSRKPAWEFEFKDLQEKSLANPDDICGTTILVTDLHKVVADEFGLENFQTSLKYELESALRVAMEKGLVITLNQIPLRFRSVELLQSDQLQPAYEEIAFEDNGNSPLLVKIFSGVSKSDPTSAGWYIFCNGRLVLEADQTLTTGWGEGGETTIPKYHNQFAMFHGYVFFDSDNTSLLPWNTTKTGVDADSPVFKAVRLKMISLMRPVIDFLNRLDAEKNADDRPLELVVEQTVMTKLFELESKQQTAFVSPKPRTSTAPKPSVGRITYSRPIEEIERAKTCLRVFSNKEVGEKTFEFYFKTECED